MLHSRNFRKNLVSVGICVAVGIPGSAFAQLCVAGKKCGGTINWGAIHVSPAPAKVPAKQQQVAPVFKQGPAIAAPIQPANPYFNPNPAVTINPNRPAVQGSPSLSQTPVLNAPVPAQPNLPAPAIVKTLPTQAPNPYVGKITTAPAPVSTPAPQPSVGANPFTGTALNPNLPKPIPSGPNPFNAVLPPVKPAYSPPANSLSAPPVVAVPAVAPHLVTTPPNPFAKVLPSQPLKPPPVQLTNSGAAPSPVNPFANVLAPPPVSKSQVGAAVGASAAVVAGIPLSYTAPGAVQWGVNYSQGVSWENYLQANQLASATRLRAAFPVFDFFDSQSGTAISAKTINTAAKTYVETPTGIYSKLMGYVDNVTNFKSAPMGEDLGDLNSDMISSKKIMVAIPKNTTVAQFEQIERAVEDAKQAGVEIAVNVTDEAQPIIDDYP